MKKEQLYNLATSKLDELLRTELRRDHPNGNRVRDILRVLEEREKDYPAEITPEVQAAWDKFMNQDQRRSDRWKPTARSWVTKVAATAASIVILISVFVFVIPVEAHAETFWEKLVRWTDSVVEFFAHAEQNEVHADYVFQTDNPGLQEVYDAVVELGVNEPVVPMWLPDESELIECKITSTSKKTGIQACFSHPEGEIVFLVSVYNTDAWHEYQKDETGIIEYEKNGITHMVIQNIDKWTVIWTNKNIECVLSINCQEEILYKILNSIYTGR